MAEFGQGSPFGNMQPTDLAAMLEAVFNPAQAPMPEQTQFQPRRPQEGQFIDLGLGGQQAGTERGSLLGSLGNLAQSVAPMAGSFMGQPKAPTQMPATGAFSKAALDSSLSAPAPQLTLGRNPAIKPLFSFGG